MSPRWLHWPPASAAPSFSHTGTMTATATTILQDTSPPAGYGFSTIFLRTDYGLMLDFATVGDRTSFVAAYPTGGTWTITLDGNTASPNAGWSYTLHFTDRASIVPAEFSDFTGDLGFPYVVSSTYGYTISYTA